MKTDVQLAKAYNPEKIPASAAGYYVTEKLDGNRCIALHNGQAWEFYSRNGKRLFVSFDMSMFDPARVYDGEIIDGALLRDRRAADFNALNGLIQRQYGSKSSLIYAVFDIVDESRPYFERRAELAGIQATKSAFVLPVLNVYQNAEDLRQGIPAALESITGAGGEGLIVNNGGAPYEKKRTSALLKVKQNQTMDLRVIDIEEGRGKYAGMIGALKCQAITEDGREIVTDIGTGFTDAARREWYADPAAIVGKIVETRYFEIQQGENGQAKNTFSLRFPRFLRVRSDKAETSIY